MADEPIGKSKLIVDEDWKSQVQAEKEALSHASAEPPKAEATKAPDAEAAGAGADSMAPSLSSLVITLATQSMAAMGLVAGPDGQPYPIEREHAKYMIDMIAMLDAKTQGNRTADESALFEDALYQLRMAFVETQPKG